MLKFGGLMQQSKGSSIKRFLDLFWRCKPIIQLWVFHAIFKRENLHALPSCLHQGTNFTFTDQKSISFVFGMSYLALYFLIFIRRSVSPLLRVLNLLFSPTINDPPTFHRCTNNFFVTIEKCFCFEPVRVYF